jgi:hypothetical protein
MLEIVSSQIPGTLPLGLQRRVLHITSRVLPTIGRTIKRVTHTNMANSEAAALMDMCTGNWKQQGKRQTMPWLLCMHTCSTTMAPCDAPVAIQ